MNNKLIAILFLSLIFSGCRKLFNCDESEHLTWGRQDYEGTELKTNGYYLCNTYMDTYIYFILYRNGIVITHSGGVLKSEIDNLETSFVNGNFIKGIEKDKSRWGGFRAQINKFEYQDLSSTSGNASCSSLFDLSGVILNDTTLLINNSYNEATMDNTIKNDTFHFKQFSPKPDSTNSFIK
jgi:hypothetical protein